MRATLVSFPFSRSFLVLLRYALKIRKWGGGEGRFKNIQEAEIVTQDQLPGPRQFCLA